MTMLFISHDLGIVRRIADKVAVMRDGKIVETGAVEDVFRQPQAAYTRTLLASIPRVDLARLEGLRDEDNASPSGDASVSWVSRISSAVNCEV